MIGRRMANIIKRFARRRDDMRFVLRLDPMFDLLRNDPRFQKLAESAAPKE
jgi:hypothetical protein